MTDTARAVAIVSGGMDSVALAHLLKQQGYELTLLSVNYGQRHAVKELFCAARCADRLASKHEVVDLRDVTRLLTGSALTDPTVEVPHGHYAEDSMRATVVPNRNAILLSLAVAVAVAQGARVVATGVHAGDHAVYPDCRPEFIDAFEAMARVANEGFLVEGFEVEAPWLHMTKADVVDAATRWQLAVPWSDTWSCYEGGERHCGECGTCVERREAFDVAGVPDPTEYAQQAFKLT